MGDNRDGHSNEFELTRKMGKEVFSMGDTYRLSYKNDSS
jgi:hypothetical protein